MSKAKQDRALINRANEAASHWQAAQNALRRAFGDEMPIATEVARAAGAALRIPYTEAALRMADTAQRYGAEAALYVGRRVVQQCDARPETLGAAPEAAGAPSAPRPARRAADTLNRPQAPAVDVARAQLKLFGDWMALPEPRPDFDQWLADRGRTFPTEEP